MSTSRSYRPKGTDRSPLSATHAEGFDTLPQISKSRLRDSERSQVKYYKQSLEELKQGCRN